MNSENKDKETLITYTATDLLTNEIISAGSDVNEVDRLAEESGRPYMINFITNPNYAFVF